MEAVEALLSKATIFKELIYVDDSHPHSYGHTKCVAMPLATTILLKIHPSRRFSLCQRKNPRLITKKSDDGMHFFYSSTFSHCYFCTVVAVIVVLRAQKLDGYAIISFAAKIELIIDLMRFFAIQLCTMRDTFLIKISPPSPCPIQPNCILCIFAVRLNSICLHLSNHSFPAGYTNDDDAKQIYRLLAIVTSCPEVFRHSFFNVFRLHNEVTEL